MQLLNFMWCFLIASYILRNYVVYKKQFCLAESSADEMVCVAGEGGSLESASASSPPSTVDSDSIRLPPN